MRETEAKGKEKLINIKPGKELKEVVSIHLKQLYSINTAPI